MMKSIPSRDELIALSIVQSDPCISIFLPTSRGGAQQKQDELRLKNHFRETENRLFLRNLHTTRIDNLLRPLQMLITEEQFWRQNKDGVAIFRSLQHFQVFRLPISFKEQVVISDHFSLKPLLPLLSASERFYILALSQNDIRLLEATRYGVELATLPESVPESLADALKYEESENEVSYYSSASGAQRGKGGRHPVIFYGRGVGIDDTKEHILRYFQQINRGLHELLHDETAPLVLAGVEYLFPLYREVNTYPHLLEQGVAGNPDRLNAEQLHKQAWPVVQPYLMEKQQEAAARYAMLAGTGQASSEIREIVPAACYGRINTLFVAVNREQWGLFEPASGSIHVHEKAKFGDDDLLDIAATQTLQHRGTVYAVNDVDVPGGTLASAVFRY